MINFRMVKQSEQMYLKLESAYNYLSRLGALPHDLGRLLRVLRAAKRRYVRRIHIWQEYLSSL